jgi:hypothetical protein
MLRSRYISRYAAYTQGNVFDMASLQLLAIKPKTWRDLISDEAFKREDIITIQVRSLVPLFCTPADAV